jgi:hypothetical protein
MYGVNPGGVAAGGITAGEAQSEFREAYKSVLFDIAAEAVTFEDFEREVKQFVSDRNEPTFSDWEAAVNEVRHGRVDADWLPKRRAESRVGVDVVLVEHPAPSVNVLDEAELAA